jgi:chromate transporter
VRLPLPGGTQTHDRRQRDFPGGALRRAEVSFLAVGGLPTVLLAMQRYVVDEQHWMTSQQFTDAYALAQVAPGPNVMYVTLIGWQVASWAGAVATTLPLLAPVCTLMLLAGRLPARYTALTQQSCHWGQ